MSFLPYGRQTISAEDISAVARALESDYLTTGPLVGTLERELAQRLNAREAVVCSNGTAALHLAVLAAGIGPGDTVIVPAVTFVATANAARYCGAEVVFADVDPETGLLDLPSLEAAVGRVTGRLAAIMPVHLAGQTAPLSGIAEVAERLGAMVIEDACHALGSDDDAGTSGDCRHSAAAVFSFHPVKTITAGEGGAITTNDREMARKMRLLRSHGLIRDPDDFIDGDMGISPGGDTNSWYYEQQELGFNYRLPDINCALALSQLQRLDVFRERRRHLVALYRAALADLSPAVRPLSALPNQNPCWHLMVALIDFDLLDADRQGVMSGLREQGIGSQVHYIPVHRQPYYRARYGALDLPGADAYYGRALSLPLFPQMEDADVYRVIEALRRVLKI